MHEESGCVCVEGAEGGLMCGEGGGCQERHAQWKEHAPPQGQEGRRNLPSLAVRMQRLPSLRTAAATHANAIKLGPWQDVGVAVAALAAVSFHQCTDVFTRSSSWWAAAHHT
jgi:hypothetical protein